MKKEKRYCFYCLKEIKRGKSYLVLKKLDFKTGLREKVNVHIECHGTDKRD